MSWAARYVVHDEEGPVRTFWSRQEAVNLMCGRPEMDLEVIPAPSRRELQRQLLADSEPAVF
jgi:hypothetical protein